MQEETIESLEQQIADLSQKLMAKRAEAIPEPVPNYEFACTEGSVRLLDLFGQHDHLLVIHNMGNACSYCTLWADGINAFVPHLESAVGLVLVSKDSPQVQREFANDRGWRMRMASHGGGAYLEEQVNSEGMENYPGVACYKRQGDSILRVAYSHFGPGDLYCSIWHLLGLAGIGLNQWAPKKSYLDSIDNKCGSGAE
ncbi:MAG: DUF899 family protein [Planctomycetota bacterium]|nr:DUF899 family protein [Planctomycetota bacterium]